MTLCSYYGAPRGPRALAAAAQPAADAVAAAFGGDGFVTLTASGSVSDFSDDDKSSLQQKVADAAGVDKSLVTILVAAASVRITATIAVLASTTADAVQTSLSSTLGTTADASTVLGITVEEVPTITFILAEDTLKPQKADDDSQSSCDGACIGGITATVAVLALVLVVWLSGWLTRTGCPSPLQKFKKPTREKIEVREVEVSSTE